MRRRSFLQHTVLLTGVHLALRSSALLFRVFLSRRVGAGGMGRLQLILTVGGFAITLGISGSRAACMNLTAAQRGLKQPAAMKRAILTCLQYCLILSALSGIALFFGAEYLAERWIRDVAAAPALRLMGAYLPLQCMVAVLYGCFTARGQIRRLVIAETLETGAEMVVTALLLLFWAGSDFSRISLSVVGGYAVGAVLSFCILGALLAKDLRRIAPRRDASMLRPLLRLSVPLALSDYLRAGLNSVEEFLIPHGLSRAGGSYERSIADYGTICGMVFPVLMFPVVLFASLSDLLLPELSACKAQRQKQRIRCIVTDCLQFGMLFSGLIAGLMFLLGPALGRLLFHSESAGAYLRAFSPMVLCLYSDCLVDGMLKGMGEQVACVRYNTITAFLDVALLFLLLPLLGVTGYFISFTFTHVLNFAMSLRRLCLVTGVFPDWRHAVLTTAGGIGAVSAALLFPAPQNDVFALFYSAVLFLFFYLTFCLFAGVLRPEALRRFLPGKQIRRETARQVF